MSRQTPVLVTSAGLVGPLRESTRAYSSFTTSDNFSHVKQSSGIGYRSEVQQPLQYTRDADVAKKESDESVHKWVRLPTMPAESTMHGTCQNISDETIVNELRRRLQESDDQNQQRIEQNAHYPPRGSQDPDIEEQVSIFETHPCLSRAVPEISYRFLILLREGTRGFGLIHNRKHCLYCACMKSNRELSTFTIFVYVPNVEVHLKRASKNL